jgi:hypothetical protein
VSYSTAKKVFTKFRRDVKESLKKKVPSRLCKIRSEYLVIKSENVAASSRVTIVSMIGGVEQNETNEGNEYSP